ncbi:hypothetical protein [Streptococcus pyogenes]|uniref:hypothetical protein n=1 Tax=Streptococcus pyogenes TaxID=1314 RepID=UPI000DA29283|nr:hypothetical protein [Streptococcus pyogenes]SQG96622.1 hupothetical protein [Streptococcus pyogenes]VEE00063.1 hupothetical protein [Streptococcus pyogenes]
MIDLKRSLFKIDVRAQKDEEKVFMRTAWLLAQGILLKQNILSFSVLFYCFSLIFSPFYIWVLLSIFKKVISIHQYR